MMQSLHSGGGINGVRTVLLAECFLEVLRQVVVESWERGLLLLSIHTDRVCAQAAHRQMFETRVGHAFRLALLGEKESERLEEGIAALRTRVAALQGEEEALRQQCDAFAGEAETAMLIAERQHNEVLLKLRKEGLIKRHQLEQMIAVPPPQ
ncbi:dynein light intermediate chain, axonemal [Strigomonas culicis]|uniref:Dynein light intermediate chain, axonemal n=1 Tax=Strigomonas culicis TaxID=28005 RepID=S9URF5_9TRYP|nr:dynein light intermediate chain, axonemal [Strigomonas culicis]|eukprot:EPY33502.1 dynein light intermediate chain, axonemal [Strigomonas culicis]